MGVDGRVVHDQQEMMATLAACVGDGSIGILLVSSDVASLAREHVDELKVSSMAPLLVEIPGQGVGDAYTSLRDFVQRAVGVNLGGI